MVIVPKPKGQETEQFFFSSGRCEGAVYAKMESGASCVSSQVFGAQWLLFLLSEMWCVIVVFLLSFFFPDRIGYERNLRLLFENVLA